MIGERVVVVSDGEEGVRILFRERDALKARVAELAAERDVLRKALVVARQFAAGTDDGDREDVLIVIDGALLAKETP